MSGAIENLTAAVMPWPERARALVVQDAQSYEAAAVLLREIKGLRGEIEATFGPIVAKAHATHREALAQRKKHEAPLEIAERSLKIGMGSYAAEQERKAREERARQELAAREAEAKRQASLWADEEATRLAEAEELERAGRGAEALAVLAAPMPEEPALPPPPPVIAELPRVEGVSVRETWVAEVVAMMALVEAVAVGRAPLALITVDKVALAQFARSTRGTIAVPGVRFTARKDISSRA